MNIHPGELGVAAIVLYADLLDTLILQVREQQTERRFVSCVRFLHLHWKWCRRRCWSCGTLPSSRVLFRLSRVAAILTSTNLFGSCKRATGSSALRFGQASTVFFPVACLVALEAWSHSGLECRRGGLPGLRVRDQSQQAVST